MERTHKIEEALSIVWEEREKKVRDKASIRDKISEKVKEDILGDLVKDGYLVVDKDGLQFTAAGEAAARDVIRRQRLAERLLVDVVEVGRREMTSAACEFEHILSKEVEEGICTLLGHPKECPHGSDIPAGECCRKAKISIDTLVTPLAKLKPGETGKLVYVLTREHPQLHKLMSLGVVPGVTVTVHQVNPAFVIQIDHTHLALEEEIAKDIYVRRAR